MDAAHALADLVEISPQIEAAAVLGGDGEVLGSVGVTDWWATALARAGRTLLEAAGEYRSNGGRTRQLYASLADGEVFAVGTEGEHAVVAVTTKAQAPGLVFYDLKRCLAALSEPEPQPEPEPPQPQRRRWGRKERGGEA